MRVDVGRLSTAAQRQILQKLSESKQGTDQSRSKYGNKKVDVNGIIFDSKKEARRWLELTALEKAGVIHDLRRQVPYLLLHSQRIDGKLVEREVKYVADFVYEQNGETIVEDAKGHRTKDYVIKRKLMLAVCGIRIREV